MNSQVNRFIYLLLFEKNCMRSSNFQVGFFGIPFAILASIGLPRNNYLCLFNMSLLIVLCTISIYCLVAVSVDRYWAILYPMSYSRNVRSKTAVGEFKINGSFARNEIVAEVFPSFPSH